ncbi:ankyrin repeat domain-containing protein [Nocardia brasiliensis]|uniref:ankyrin repeat domain-containing protein n=1 Tax=Nocardia brasiliensis TaxID=37326 RepID=UPI0037B4CC82
MPVQRLCDNPDLEHLRKQAKALRKAAEAGDPTALALFAEFHPDPAAPVQLAGAQLVTARRYGFASWPKLKQHIDVVARYSRSPHQVETGADLPAEFLRLACLTYGDDYPGRIPAADALREQTAEANVCTMAATGSFDALRALLAAQPALARADGGPFDWPPLLYLCYARLAVPGRAVDAARLLLEHGADPNAGFLWDGLPSPFTAVTGALGGGEEDQPRHPQGLALARLLLEAGANANDSQALYNLGLGGSWSDDTTHLELLLEFGLGAGDGGPWKARLGPALATPAQLLREELATAALRGGPRRTRLLLDHGAEIDGRGAHPAFGGRTPYELAMLNGHREVAEILRVAGASGELGLQDQFVAACLRGDRAAATAAPELLAQALADTPDLINRAAEHGHRAAVRLLVDLGFDVNHRRRSTPLHEAAWNDDVPMAETLVALGADPTIEDLDHEATPLEFAEYGQKEAAATYLRTLADPPPGTV